MPLPSNPNKPPITTITPDAHRKNLLYQNPIETKPTQSKPDLHIRRSKLWSPQNPCRPKLHRNPPDLLPLIKTPSEPTQNQNTSRHTNLHARLATTHTPHDELNAKWPKQLRWQVLNKRGSEYKVTRRES